MEHSLTQWNWFFSFWNFSFSKWFRWTDFAWCRKQGRPALLWLSDSVEPQSSSWPWLTTPSSALTKVWWTRSRTAFLLDGTPVFAACFSHDFFVSESLLVVSLSVPQTQSSWSVGCAVMKEQFRQSRSTVQVATPSARPWTRLSSGTWTLFRGWGSWISGSLLAFKG